MSGNLTPLCFIPPLAQPILGSPLPSLWTVPGHFPRQSPALAGQCTALILPPKTLPPRLQTEVLGSCFVGGWVVCAIRTFHYKDWVSGFSKYEAVAALSLLTVSITKELRVLLLFVFIFKIFLLLIILIYLYYLLYY